MRINSQPTVALFFAVIAAVSGDVNAGTAFTDEAAFLTALGSQATTLDFDDLPDRTVVTNQYSGVTFGNAGIWNWSNNTANGGNVTPPNNLYNIDGLNGEAIEFVFDVPVTAVGLYNSSPGVLTDRVQMTLFDGQNAILFQGDLPETDINFLGYIASSPTIARGEAVGIPPTNGFIFLDNFTFAVVPEPSTLVTGLIGFAMFFLRLR